MHSLYSAYCVIIDILLILELLLIMFIHNGILKKDVSHILTLIIALKKIAFKQQYTKLLKWE